MKIVIRDSKSTAACHLALIFKGRKTAPADPALKGASATLLSRSLREGILEGNVGEITWQLLPDKAAAKTLVTLGCGRDKALTATTLRRAFGTLARYAARKEIGELSLSLGSDVVVRAAKRIGWRLTVQTIVEAWHLGGYRYDDCRSSPPKKPRGLLRLLPGDLDSAASKEARAGLKIGDAAAAGVLLARDLANAPANMMFPETLASRARAMAKRSGLKCRVLNRNELEKEGMGALLGVSLGSDRPPKLIVLEYQPRAKSTRTICLVGKAVTFDSGGISIKPARGMEDMKFDMAGGAAVIGAMQYIAALRPTVKVVGIVPSSENLINGCATRPGDVLTSASGKTIEVINTDAEGRLLLADALHYAKRFKPDAVVDIATLTGAIVIALGSNFTGYFTNDRKLGRRVAQAGELTGERVWEMPIFPEAHEAMKSRVADLKNSGGREAGASTAAAFLEAFVDDFPWVHLDIAGTGWSSKIRAEHPGGASGVGVRLMAEMVFSFQNS